MKNWPKTKQRHIVVKSATFDVGGKLWSLKRNERKIPSQEIAWLFWISRMDPLTLLDLNNWSEAKTSLCVSWKLSTGNTITSLKAFDDHFHCISKLTKKLAISKLSNKNSTNSAFSKPKIPLPQSHHQRHQQIARCALNKKKTNTLSALNTHMFEWWVGVLGGKHFRPVLPKFHSLVVESEQTTEHNDLRTSRS